jgi:hypothetical protein
LIGGSVSGGVDVEIVEVMDDIELIADRSCSAGVCVLGGEVERGGFHKGFGATLGFCILVGFGGIKGGDFARELWSLPIL